MAMDNDRSCSGKSADFAYWSRMAYWTLEEAAALGAGAEPGTGALGQSAERNLVLLERAFSAGLLREKIAPADFQAWADDIGFELPADLAALLRGTRKATNWKQEAERLAVEATRLEEGFEHYKLQYARSKREIEGLTTELTKMREAAADTRNMRDNTGPSRKAFNTLLRLVGGMAMAVYKYNPLEKKSDVVRQIQDDLAFKGLDMDEDTIRKYIRDGAILVNSEAERSGKPK